MTASRRNTLAFASLVAVAIAWGAAFVLMKPAIEQQPIFDFLATRFTIAPLFMLLIRPGTVRKINPKLLWQGSVAGIFLGLGYVTQTIGLHSSTAAITGFFTGLYVILTPILAWFFYRHRPNFKVAVGTVLATVGLGILSASAIAWGWGEASLLACALLFALHIVVLGRWSPNHDVYALTVVQLAVVGILNWIGAGSDGYQAPPNATVWFAVLFTAVFATALAFLVQTWAQSIIDASRVAIVLTSEVVFAAVISVMVGQEVLAPQTIVGGAIILVAMLVAEWPGRRPDAIVPLEPMAH
ncbi:MAG: hypothetical protein RLZZ626_613 [Actinomycetota bacterium]